VRETSLLTLDAAINLILGILLALFPRTLAAFLGIPMPENAFYASILGAVLVGIGVALLVERYRGMLRVAGLGVAGAMIINLFGASALVAWLVSGPLDISLRGRLILWGIALLVLATAALELIWQIPNKEHNK
jgi:NO-binding membrane sensor protein with MHYT domain